MHPAHDPKSKPARAESRPHIEAAFFDVDGTLIRTNLVHIYAYYAFNTGSLADMAMRAGKLFGSIPAWMAIDKVSRRAFNRAFFRAYKGISEDRLHILSEELFEEVISVNIVPGAVRILEQCKAIGARIVLVTGGLDMTMEPLARHLGVDDVISNRLEFVRGKATGNVVPPLVEGATKAAAMRAWAAREGVDLDRCAAYSDSWSDYPMLAVVGRPTAINPDLRLRNAARDYQWPVVDTDA